MTSRTEQIQKMRMCGESLRRIGPKFGISYERVRQILEKNPVPGLGEFIGLRKLAALSGKPFQRIKSLAAKGILPKARETSFRFYHPSQVEAVNEIYRTLLTCPICGGRKYKVKSLACVPCWRKYPGRFSEGSKERRVLASKKWYQKHKAESQAFSGRVMITICGLNHHSRRMDSSTMPNITIRDTTPDEVYKLVYEALKKYSATNILTKR